ncbi:MAG: hypothetical protein J1F11_08365 [Oscillospiraceae bacterium]|nr:hypothetical protein [Oscillospiraceae bacterium]
MASFKLSINVEPKDIPFLDDAHKRDCADAITNAVNSTLKYTLIMTGTVMALFAAYSFFGFIWMMRMDSMLPSVPAFVPVAAAVMFIFEFISGTMKKWALALQLLFHAVMVFAAVTSPASIAVVPFVLYGAVLHVKLLNLLPWYDVISVQPGYPEFTPLPGKDEIILRKKDEDTASGPDADKSADAGNRSDAAGAETPEKQSDTKAPENEAAKDDAQKPENETAKDDVQKPESTELQANANKPSGGSGKKKHKNRKRKK